MRRIIGVFVGILLFLATGLAQAQGVTYAEKTEYSFDDDVVTGDLVRPDGLQAPQARKGRLGGNGAALSVIRTTVGRGDAPPSIPCRPRSEV